MVGTKTHAGDRPAKEEHNFFCDRANLCAAYFESEAAQVKIFCDISHFSAVWEKGIGKYLFQCHADDTSEEGYRSWVVDINNKVFFKINYGKFYDKKSLIENPNSMIGDSFKARPLCHKANVEYLKWSDFILLKKRPSDNEQNPYCYEIIYLAISGRNLTIFSSENNARKDLADQKQYAVSLREKEGLKKLLQSLR